MLPSDAALNSDFGAALSWARVSGLAGSVKLF